LILSFKKAAYSIFKLQIKSYSFLALKFTLLKGTEPGKIESSNWQKILPAPKDSILVTLTFRLSFIHFNISF
jgi:hypothetical protein